MYIYRNAQISYSVIKYAISGQFLMLNPGKKIVTLITQNAIAIQSLIVLKQHSSFCIRNFLIPFI